MSARRNFWRPALAVVVRLDILLGSQSVGCLLTKVHRVLGSHFALQTHNRSPPRVDPDLVNLVPTSSNFRSISPQISSMPGQSWPSSAELAPNLIKLGPNSTEIAPLDPSPISAEIPRLWSKIGRHQLVIGQTRHKFGRFRLSSQIWTSPGHSFGRARSSLPQL